MKQLLSLLLLGIALSSVAQPAKPIFPTPLSPRLANYQIDVTLDPISKKIKGQETLTWHNPSNDVIRELRFHLYLNAFRNEKSTFMRESGGQLRGDAIDRNSKENPYGSIDIVSMSRRGGQSAGRASGASEPLAYQFIQPDDQAAGTQNKDDHTVIRVPLSKPVGPGETIVLDKIGRAHV